MVRIMSDLINNAWRPHVKTSSTLRDDGYTGDQLKRLGFIFIDRYMGKTIQQASTTFNNFVRRSEMGQNVPVPESTTLKDIDDKRADKAEDSAERVIEVKKTDGVMTQAEAIAWYEEQKIKTS